jgi:hypothetical protein
MNSKNIAILAGVLVALAASPALAQSSNDWVDITSAKELRALPAHVGGLGGRPGLRQDEDGYPLLPHPAPQDEAHHVPLLSALLKSYEVP